MLKGFKDNNEDSDALLDAYIKLYNDCLSARPSDMHVGVHLCRGNFVGGRHFSEGGYDAIATKLFRKLNVVSLHPRVSCLTSHYFINQNSNAMLNAYFQSSVNS